VESVVLRTTLVRLLGRRLAAIRLRCVRVARTGKLWADTIVRSKPMQAHMYRWPYEEGREEGETPVTIVRKRLYLRTGVDWSAGWKLGNTDDPTS